NKFFVRRPKSLAEADWVVDDLGNRGVPIPALPIVEYSVAADHQVIRIPGGERGGDGHFLSRPRAIAISQISAGKARERRVLRRVGDVHAKVAAARVEIKSACLEDGGAAMVKIGKGNEVVQKAQKVALHADELLEGGEILI